MVSPILRIRSYSLHDILHPLSKPVENKSQTISPPLASPSSAIHLEVEPQLLYPVRGNEISKSEKAEVEVAEEETPVPKVLEAGIGTEVETS